MSIDSLGKRMVRPYQGNGRDSMDTHIYTQRGAQCSGRAGPFLAKVGGGGICYY